MAGNIFISYRRDDAAAWAGRLHLALQKHFKKNQLFMDVDNIPAGLDFVKVLDQEVAKCDVLLAVIGKSWLSTANAQGQRRIDDPADFVRIEIESALKRDIRLIPILVDGAGMPAAGELPEGLVPLTRRQAFVVTHARFGSDIDALAGQLGQVFKAGPATQANWSGFQAEMARFANQAAGAVQSAGVDTQKLTAGAQKAKSVAKAVGWSYLALLGGALVGGIVAIVLTGGRVESELGQGIIGVGGVLGVVVYWVRRKRRQ